MNIIRVLLADKTKSTKTTLISGNSNGHRIEVVGVSDDGHEALRMVQTTRPDVAVFSENLQSLDGFSAVEQLHMLQPDIGLLLITEVESDGQKIRADNVGAHYHLPRANVEADLANAVKMVADKLRENSLE